MKQRVKVLAGAVAACSLLAGCVGPEIAALRFTDSVSLSHVYSVGSQPQIIVKHAPGASRDAGWLKGTGAQLKLVRSNAAAGTDVVAVTSGSFQSALQALSKTPGVLYAEPNYRLSLPDLSGEPLARGAHEPNFPGVFAPQLIHSLEVNQQTMGVDQVIAIVDTGIDLTHPNFAGKLVPGINILDAAKSPADDAGHGTNCAGIAASLPDKTAGIVGVAPGAKLMPVKVLDAEGNGSEESMAAGIRWAADHGATVINLSMGGPDSSQTGEEAIQYAISKGIVVVASMGNGGFGKKSYPAAYPGVIPVAASDVNDAHPGFSNTGPWCSVTAPGYSILSTYPTYRVTGIDEYLKNKFLCEKYGLRMELKYAYLSGTSQAAPHVAGLAALLKSVHPEMLPEEIKRRMEKGADDVPEMFGSKFDTRFGYGRINAMRAI